jgi:hypothetical protein
MVINKRRGKNKHGLSPVVATSLLITLVLVLSVIVFLWMRGFVTEQIIKFDKPVEQVCDQVDFEVSIAPGGESAYEMEIANRGNVEIYNFDIKEVFKNGESVIEKFKFPANIGESIRKPFNPGSTTQSLCKIIVYPVILGNVKDKTLNKMFTCTNKGKIISNPLNIDSSGCPE